MDRAPHLLPLLLTALLFGSSLPVHAVRIEFTVTTESGVDRWRYDYFVSGHTFDLDQGFAIYFDPALYHDLAGLPVSIGWDPLVIQPDPAIPDEGIFDVLKVSDHASLASPFSVGFTWLGLPGTLPGPQPFELYDLVGGVPMPFTTGLFTEARSPVGVPVPPTVVLMASGVAVLLYARRPYRRVHEARFSTARSR